MHNPLNPSRTHATHVANNSRTTKGRFEMIVSVIGCPNSGPATKVLTLPTSHQDRAVTPTGCVMSRLSASGPHRASLWRRLRPRENAATLLRGARVAALVLAAAALALGVAENAAAQTTLVSNFDATSGIINASLDREGAQAFTTGATGATVSSVEIISADAEGDEFDLSLCTTSSNDRPTSTCTPLTAPSSFAAGTLVFTAPANTTLDPTTTYAVLITPERKRDGARRRLQRRGPRRRHGLDYRR